MSKRAYSVRDIEAKKWVTLPWGEKWSLPFGYPADNARWFISGASASGKKRRRNGRHAPVSRAKQAAASVAASNGKASHGYCVAAAVMLIMAANAMSTGTVRRHPVPFAPSFFVFQKKSCFIFRTDLVKQQKMCYNISIP